MGKKLIEVAPFLPLDAISVASKADKDKKTGTIKNVHKWFAPMPTPALRALIFAAVVDAPDDEEERARLLDLVERLVPVDGNPPDPKVLEEAREEIRASSGGERPTIFDPFCGGGSTLIEAQRLGLPAMGSDLNPVPVLITRTLTQLVPQVAGRPSLVGATGTLGSAFSGTFSGLFADVTHYAEQVRAEVREQVGHLYPAGPKGETVIASLWARTVKCPNPTCGVTVPLISDLWLSKKKGDKRWIDVDAGPDGVRLSIGSGEAGPAEPIKLPGNRPKFRCPRCHDGVADEPYLRAEGLGGRMGTTPTALAMVRDRARTYATFSADDVPTCKRPMGVADVSITRNARWFSPPSYGLTEYEDIFTDRQLVMLEAFADAVADLPEQVRADGGDEVYAATIASILGLALGKLAQNHSTQSRWYIDKRNGSPTVQAAFGRHAMPMVWDFVELNPFAAGVVGDWLGQTETILRGLARLPEASTPSTVRRSDARVTANEIDEPVVIVTDPPYFDQIGYADLSDFFYVWHRKALRKVHPDLYATIVTPKDEELIATPFRHDGDKVAASRYFVEGFTETFRSLKTAASDDNPILIVYAHRQEESSSLGTASTGWDAMLEAILAAGLVIEGTLPIRGTGSSRQIAQGTNALAAYTVMVCRPRTAAGEPGTIADLRTALRQRLPAAVEALLDTGESMVDIRQAAIGPGMEVYSQFSSLFDGSEPIAVHRALTIINDELGRLLDEHLGEVDAETRWACQWYTDHHFDEGDYDEGRQLAQTYGIGVNGLADAGLVTHGASKVRLLARSDLKGDWTGEPTSARDRTPVWEACQHLVKRLTEGATAGEQAAARLLVTLGPKATGVRELAQYLTNLAIEKGWSDDAIAYDALVKSWPRIEELAAGVGAAGDVDGPDSGRLFTA